jgi:hypothetical protein
MGVGNFSTFQIPFFFSELGNFCLPSVYVMREQGITPPHLQKGQRLAGNREQLSIVSGIERKRTYRHGDSFRRKDGGGGLHSTQDTHSEATNSRSKVRALCSSRSSNRKTQEQQVQKDIWTSSRGINKNHEFVNSEIARSQASARYPV